MTSKLEIFTDESKKFEHLAMSATKTMEDVSASAMLRIKARVSTSPSSVMAYSNADIINSVEANLNKINNKMALTDQVMASTPILAKSVVQINDTKEIREYYFAIGGGISGVVSIDADLGRLASFPVGEEYVFDEDVSASSKDAGRIFTVIQQSKFNNVFRDKNNKWDSKLTYYSDLKNQSLVTLKSLVVFLPQQDDVQDSYDEISVGHADIAGVSIKNDSYDDFEMALRQISHDEEKKNNIIYGRLHETLSSFQFRVEHILDKEQDDISRLPLGRSLILLGPAGSGKTTTLIHRVRRKLNTKHLSEGENKILQEVGEDYRPHEDNWIMFTPTELLGLQLQKAFNEDGVLASNKNVMTWQNHANYLGREFEILRLANRAGFDPDREANHFANFIESRIDVYNNFCKWVVEKYIENSTSSISTISSFDIDEELFNLLDCIENAKNKFLARGDLISYLLKVIELREEVDRSISILRAELNGIIESSMRKLGSRVLNFYSFLQANKKNSTLDADDFDGVEEIFLEASNINDVKQSYKRAVVQYAEILTFTPEKKMSPNNKKIIEWLGEELLPTPKEITRIGELCLQLRAFSSFENPIKYFFKKINVHYKSFREYNRINGNWYKKEISSNIIDATELDILILYHLQMMNHFIKRSIVWKNFDSSLYKYLRDRCKEYYHQVLVDEAPDFSPLQLKCMSLLSHPQINSFFACGDFSQRTNTTGTSSYEELKKFFAHSLEKREIDISYRQNKILFEFSKKILQVINNTTTSMTEKCAGFANEGYLPVLGEDLSDINLAYWIADRVCEIEKLLDNELPSIGILVPEESYVVPVANNLSRALMGRTSVLVEACSNGHRVGTERAIRVFDIQHIKGLEFEAAIFVAFDRMTELYPTLSGNFLYVGATRAANFLGVTCERVLPQSLKTLRDSFASSWEDI